MITFGQRLMRMAPDSLAIPKARGYGTPVLNRPQSNYPPLPPLPRQNAFTDARLTQAPPHPSTNLLSYINNYRQPTQIQKKKTNNSTFNNWGV